MKHKSTQRAFANFVYMLFSAACILWAASATGQDATLSNISTENASSINKMPFVKAQLIQEYSSLDKQWQKGGMFQNYTQSQEIISKRDRTSKHFVKPDGTVDALITSGASLHYLANDGLWKEIFTGIKPSSDVNYKYENTSNTVISYFPGQNLNSKGVRIGKAEQPMILSKNSSIIWLGTDNRVSVLEQSKNASAVAYNNTVTYKNSFSTGDIEYTIEMDKVKYEIVLNSLPQNIAGLSGTIGFSENIELPAGWSLVANGSKIESETTINGSLAVADASGKIMYFFPVPDIYEANNISVSLINDDGSSKAGKTYFVKPLGNGYQVAALVPAEWLQARTFPVIIDPTSTIYATDGGWQSITNSVFLDNPAYIYTGFYNAEVYRAWAKFNTSSINDGAGIYGVSMALNCDLAGTTNATTIYTWSIENYYGPYGAYNTAYYNDLGDGTNYNSYTVSSTGLYAATDLGVAAATKLQSELANDRFQVGVVNGNTADANYRKRFNALTYIVVSYTEYCTDFTAPDNTTISGWTEQVGDWAIYSNQLQSPVAGIYNWITNDASSQQDGYVSCRAIYSGGASIKFAGLTARYTTASTNIMAKIQDNGNVGYFDSYFFYCNNALVSSGSTGLNFGTDANIKLEYVGSAVTLLIDTNRNGTWDYNYTATVTNTGSGLCGVCAYTQCLIDDWCYGNGCTHPGAATNVTADPPNICLSSSSNLTATSPYNTIYWYTTPTGGTPIGSSLSGAGFTVNPSATTTYYAEAQSNPSITPMPDESSTFTGYARGYWFTAPCDFTISGVNCPASGATQHIAIVKLTAVPPTYASTTNAFTTLFLTQGNANTGIIPCNVAVAAGDIIGVLGTRGADVNSYGTGPAITTINGYAVTITRLGMQHALSTTAPADLWTGSGNISRVELIYSSCPSPSRTAVQVKVLDPVVPTFTTATPSVICNGGSSNLNAISNGNMIQWYTTLTGGSPIGMSGSGIDYAVSPVTTTTYYAEAQAGDGPTPMPAETGTYSPDARGYYFTAPCDFTITALNCLATGATQNIAVVKLTGTPPVFPSTTNAFTTLFLTQGNALPGLIPCNIPVSSGDIIGILGTRGSGTDMNSYGPNPSTTVINGQTITISRLAMQYPLSTTAPTDLYTEVINSISRVEFSYMLPCASASRSMVTVTVADPATPTAVTATPSTICSGSSSMLNATSANDSINWYTVSSGGSPVGSSYTGGNFSVSPATTTTYYAEAASHFPIPSVLTTAFLNSPLAFDGNMFDVDVLQDMTVQSFDINDQYTGGSATYEVYYKTGTYVGSENNAGAWTLLATTGTIISNGPGFPTPLNLALNLNLTAGQTYAFYITSNSGSRLNYYTGTGVGNVCASNADIKIKEGCSLLYPFNTSTMYAPRVWNGSIHYDLAGSCINSSRVPVTVDVSQPPTTADAGPDQTGSSTCGLTTVTLAGNSPTEGTGAWAIVSGTGGTITTPSSPTSTFSGVAGSTYVLSWTISNNPCTASTDNITITFNQVPAAPTATATIYYCEDDVATPLTATGTNLLWYTVPTGGTGNTTAPTPITTTPGTTSYYVSQTVGICESARTQIDVIVTAIPPKPVITLVSPDLHSSAPTGNQWYNGSGIIAGATSQNYTPPSNGSYYVIVTINGCVSDTSDIYVLTNFGIQSMNENPGVYVYPNPTSGKVTIDLPENNQFDRLSVYDNIGQLMAAMALDGNLKKVIDLTSYATGVYFIHLDGNRSLVIKVVKQ